MTSVCPEHQVERIRNGMSFRCPAHRRAAESRRVISPSRAGRAVFRRSLRLLDASIARKESLIRELLSQFPELEVSPHG